MTAVLLAGAVVLISFVVISRQRAVAMPVVFRILPAGLLFLTLPAATSAFATISGFHYVGAGGGSSANIPTLLAGVCVTMLLGAVALLGTMVAAVIVPTGVGGGQAAVTLQISGSSTPASGDPLAETAVARPVSGFRWFALLSPIALVPAVLVAGLLAETSALVMQAKTALTGQTQPVLVNGMDLSQLAGYISARLVISLVGGTVGSVTLLLAALLNVLPIHRGASAPVARKYVWIVVGITSAAAIVLAVRFAFVLTSIRRGP
jgi:hypothetical protein